MKKKIINCIYFIFLFLSFLSVSGCSDLNVPEVPDVEQGFCVVKGDVGQENSISRQASPVFVSSKYSYIIKAFQGDDENNSVEVTTNERSFVMKLRYGTWNFRAIVKYDGKEILTELISGKEISSETENISFSKFSHSLGAGTVKLQINKASGSTASKILCVWNDDVNEYTQTVSAGGIFNMIDDLRKFSADGKIPSGNYKVRFYIKDSAGNNKGIFIENITVYAEQATTRFFDTSMNYINSQGQIELTPEIETPVRNNYHVSSDGKEYGTGSKSSPLKTIQKAVDIIEAVNDGVSKYTITIISPIKAGENEGNLVSALDSVKVLAVINPSKKLNLDILGKGNLISGENNSLRGFYIGKNANVNLNSIYLSNFDSSAIGSGFYIDGDCNLGGLSNIAGEIFLSEGKTISVDSSFSESSENEIQLTFPENNGEYTEERNVLSGENLSAIINFFKIKNDSSGNAYKLTDEGKLIIDDGSDLLPSISSVLDGLNIFDGMNNPFNSGASEYAVKTADELKKLGQITQYVAIGINIKLLKNIDLGCDESNPFTPIGANMAYKGTFDGNGKTVSGLYVKNNQYSGLFGKLNGATIKNLTVEGTVVGSDTKGTGGIAATLTVNSTISDCVSKVYVSSEKGCTGGICGDIKKGKIINCINIGSVYVNGASASGIGGIAGQIEDSSSEIYNCANLGDVKGHSNVGGITGTYSAGNIKNCYNAGSVSIIDSSNSTYGAITGDKRLETDIYYYNESCSKAFGQYEDTTGAFILDQITTLQSVQTLLDSWIDENQSDSEIVYKKWKDTFTFNKNGIDFPVCIKCE